MLQIRTSSRGSEVVRVVGPEVNWSKCRVPERVEIDQLWREKEVVR